MRMSHVTHMNESCQACGRAILHVCVFHTERGTTRIHMYIYVYTFFFKQIHIQNYFDHIACAMARIHIFHICTYFLSRIYIQIYTVSSLLHLESQFQDPTHYGAKYTYKYTVPQNIARGPLSLGPLKLTLYMK